MIDNLNENLSIYCLNFLNLQDIIILSTMNNSYNNLIKKYYTFILRNLISKLIKTEDENNITLGKDFYAITISKSILFDIHHINNINDYFKKLF